jgi:hypothetical protein
MGKEEEEEEEIGLHSFSKYCRITSAPPPITSPSQSTASYYIQKNIATFGRLFWTTYRVLGYVSVVKHNIIVVGFFCFLF